MVILQEAVFVTLQKTFLPSGLIFFLYEHLGAEQAALHQCSLDISCGTVSTHILSTHSWLLRQKPVVRCVLPTLP